MSAGFPRVLVVSHNVIGGATGMGKTLASMLACVPRDNLAQLYFQPELPTRGLCARYFRVTDADVLRSAAGRGAAGRALSVDAVRLDAVESRTDSGVERRAHLIGRRRTPLTYMARNALWRAGEWFGPELQCWLMEFAPDVVFFASGDYAFAYEAAYRVSEFCDAPLVTWCCDDYYVNGLCPGEPLSRRATAELMAAQKKVGSRTVELVVISDEMKRDYTAFFNCPVTVVKISAEPNPRALPAGRRSGVLYAGGLGLGRDGVLIGIGASLAREGLPGLDHVDVYSGEADPKVRERVGSSPGIALHDAVGSDEVSRLEGAARYVLHVESPLPRIAARTRYSISTKIGELLTSGACILACGPEDIASIGYLRRADAAAIAANPRDTIAQIKRLEADSALRERVVGNARALARRDHSAAKNEATMRCVIERTAQAGPL